MNDVGQSAWEEIDLGQAGADYGWPCREGAHTALTTNKCSPTPANMLDPYFEFPHGTIPGTTTSGCGSITGGAWVPAGAWPASYDRTYMFADFNCGAIARLTPGAPPTASDFATGLGASTLVELLFGPSPTGTSPAHGAPPRFSRARRATSRSEAVAACPPAPSPWPRT